MCHRGYINLNKGHSLLQIHLGVDKNISGIDQPGDQIITASKKLQNDCDEKQGSSFRFKVEPNVEISRKWRDFLHVNEYKVEHFLVFGKGKHPFPEGQGQVGQRCIFIT